MRAVNASRASDAAAARSRARKHSTGTHNDTRKSSVKHGRQQLTYTHPNASSQSLSRHLCCYRHDDVRLHRRTNDPQMMTYQQPATMREVPPARPHENDSKQFTQRFARSLPHTRHFACQSTISAAAVARVVSRSPSYVRANAVNSDCKPSPEAYSTPRPQRRARTHTSTC